MMTSSIKPFKTTDYNPNGIVRTFAKVGGKISEKIDTFCNIETNTSLEIKSQFAIMAVCVLFARYIQARNKDEKREILTRDIGMLFTAVYGVSVFKKLASIFINKKTGIPIAYGKRGFKNNIDPEKGMRMASYDQLREWLTVKQYKDFKNIKKGFVGFCENIQTLGGDMMKCLNILDKNSGNTLEKIAKKIGYDKEINNNNIIDLIKKAEQTNSLYVKRNLYRIKKLFLHDREKNIINPLLKKASYMKSSLGLTSIALSATLLGGILPWFNIQHTKHLYKNKKQENPDLNNDRPKTIPANRLSVNEKFELFKSTGQIV